MKKHILIAWELGGGLGHIARISAIAKGLVAAGHQISLCVQDLPGTHQFVRGLPLDLFQTPLWLKRLKGVGPPACFSEMLIHRGYASPEGLTSHLSSWTDLIATLNPDLMIVDCAPTAMLAARGTDLPMVLLSNGYHDLPPEHPDPCLTPWEEGVERRTRQSEQRVVAVINRALEHREKPPISRIADIYQPAVKRFALLLPELDYWGQRSTVTYLPPVAEGGDLPRPQWPEGTGKKVLAYLKPRAPQTPSMLDALARTDCLGLVVCHGLPAEKVREWQRPGLQIHTEAQDLSACYADADLVICHAGKSSLSSALLQGTPVMMLPQQLEQLHGARSVDRRGAGLTVPPNAPQAQVQQSLQDLLSKSTFREKARQISQQNAHLKDRNPVTEILTFCASL